MPSVALIHVSESELEVVRAELPRQGKIRIDRTARYTLQELFSPAAADIPPNSDPSGTEVVPPSAKAPAAPPISERLAELRAAFPAEEIDTVSVVVSSSKILFQTMRLPFADPKKLEQVVPLQVQDQLPFDVDSFVIDVLPLGQREDGDWDVLAALMPKDDLRLLLSRMSLTGLDPKLVVPCAAAISGLAMLSEEPPAGTFAVLLDRRESSSIAVFVNGEFRILRDMFWRSGTESRETRLTQELRSVFGRVEAEHGRSVDLLLVLGSPEDGARFAERLGVPVQALTLETLAETGPEVSGTPADFAWAIGAAVLDRRREGMVNFRRGEFAYRAAYGQLLSAVREQAFALGLLLCCCVVWVGALFYSSEMTSARIERAFQDNIQQVLPGEHIPFGAEVVQVRSRADDLEERQRSMGTLSGLSPLQTLKELSTAIPANVDVTLDSVSIGHSRVSLSGSVSDFPAVGRLSTALDGRPKEFCDVKVDPKGQVAGSSRVRVTVDMKLCD